MCCAPELREDIYNKIQETLDQSLKLTFELENNSSSGFLDILLIRRDVLILISIGSRSNRFLYYNGATQCHICLTEQLVSPIQNFDMMPKKVKSLLKLPLRFVSKIIKSFLL